jgi:hypothetical protein
LLREQGVAINYCNKYVNYFIITVTQKQQEKSMLCIQCKEARFVSGTQMCRNDGRIFCEKLQKLVDKYQECELESFNKKEWYKDSKK